MSILTPVAQFLSIGKTRNFSGFKGYVTIQESTTDSLEITQQPVQQGASISDHAFKKPISLSIQIQFNTAFNLPVGGALIGGLFGQSLAQIYQNLLELQVPKPPAVLTTFDVSTLKRTYKNMLLATLGCTTDKRTENVLAINATFQECIIVPISTTTLPRSLLKTPAKSAATESMGKKSAFLTAVQGILPGVAGFFK